MFRFATIFHSLILFCVCVLDYEYGSTCAKHPNNSLFFFGSWIMRISWTERSHQSVCIRTFSFMLFLLFYGISLVYTFKAISSTHPFSCSSFDFYFMTDISIFGAWDLSQNEISLSKIFQLTKRVVISLTLKGKEKKTDDWCERIAQKNMCSK